MYDKDFYVTNSLGIANFLISVIDAGKYVFKAIIFIHVALVNEIGVFLKIFILWISNIPLILYFSHIFTFNNVVEIISLTIYRWKAYGNN